MNTKTKLLTIAIAVAMGSFSTAAIAQDVNPKCTTSCNNSDQTMGDTSSSADDSTSQATQSNPSSNSNASAAGVTINPQVQQSGNSNATQSDNRLSTNSSALGNRSTNANQSSATTGQSYSGGNTMTGGSNTAHGGRGGAGGDSRSVSQGGKVRTGDIGSTSSSGGNTTASGASADNSGNSAVNVDTGSHAINSGNSRFMVLPDVPMTPPAILASGNMVIAQVPCGPKQVVLRDPQYALVIGFWGGVKRTEIGHTDRFAYIAPGAGVFDTAVQNGQALLVGQAGQVVTSIIGSAAGRNISIGGGGSSRWASGGGGNTGSIQTVNVTITLWRCIYAQPRARVIIEQAPAPVVHHVRRHHPHKHVVHCPSDAVMKICATTN